MSRYPDASQWIDLVGDERRIAIQEAAALLLRDYWSRSVTEYVDLDLLCETLGVSLLRTRGLGGDVRLLPTPHGFRILLDEALPPERQRMAIAHELVHTLFYDRPVIGSPRRLKPPSSWEENFCFDAARRILAPSRLVKAPGFLDGLSPGWMFWTVVKKLRLSRPTAARVLLDDHQVMTGVAARWLRRAGEWTLDRGSATATPRLSREERRTMHDIVRTTLETGEFNNTAFSVVLNRSLKQNSVFALIVTGEGTIETDSSHTPQMSLFDTR